MDRAGIVGSDGAVLYLGAPTLARLDAWCAAAGVDTAELDAPLFQRIARGGTPRGQLSARSVRRIITARCSAAGVEGRISGHSLRVGSAQSLAARGAVARLRYGTAK